MKIVIIVFFFALTGCGPESSPEGRSKIRDEKIQQQIDSLKNQNRVIIDSLDAINQEIKKLKGDR
ncbi:MAG: hypothetical protein ABIN89_08955 [Chitinophagaceae bacterium]